MEFNIPHINEKPKAINSVPILKLRNNPPKTPLWVIAREVAKKHDLTIAIMRSKKRVGPIVAARWEYFYRALNETSKTCSAIARILLVDHTTVPYGATRYALQHDLPAPKAHSWDSIARKMPKRGYPKDINSCREYALRRIERISESLES